MRLLSHPSKIFQNKLFSLKIFLITNDIGFLFSNLSKLIVYSSSQKIV